MIFTRVPSGGSRFPTDACLLPGALLVLVCTIGVLAIDRKERG